MEEPLLGMTTYIAGSKRKLSHALVKELDRLQERREATRGYATPDSWPHVTCTTFNIRRGLPHLMGPCSTGDAKDA